MDLDLLRTELESMEFLMLSGPLSTDQHARYHYLCARERALLANRTRSYVGVDGQ
jgi:hypothetical protein